MNPSLPTGLLLLALCVDAAASDLYTEINRLRAEAGTCSVAGTVPPMNPQAALERVARELSQGSKLSPSLTAAGYRANRSSALNVSGDDARAQAADQLKKHYCRELRNPAMTEIGIYEGSRQVWVVMAAPFAPSVGMSEQAAAQRMLDLVNQARAQSRYCGTRAAGAAGPVRWNDTLAEAALRHSEDMARNNYFDHNDLNGATPAQRLQRTGYRYSRMGENIAAGQMRPEDAVAVWIKSPEHCANLMDPLFTEMGTAYAVDSRSRMGVYWTQEFGAPR